MTSLLLVGSTGLVGRHVLQQALADARIGRVVAPTRRALTPHPKLQNPIVDFHALPPDERWWAVDAAICALGTTRAVAGSAASFRTIDKEIPLSVANLALAHGARSFALCSAMGADANSRLLYSRTKGELEEGLQALGFASLTFVRPGLIGGQREQNRPGERLAERVLAALEPILPRSLRISPVEKIAAALIAGALAGAPGLTIVGAAQLAR